jgi:hypothetical protein
MERLKELSGEKYAQYALMRAIDFYIACKERSRRRKAKERSLELTKPV